MLRIVNMIPASLSGETNQDSGPNLAINPENTYDLLATAFTPAPLGGPSAPFYVSIDGGDSWTLNSVAPDAGSARPDDITVGFATVDGAFHAAVLDKTAGRIQILNTASYVAASAMTVSIDRAQEGQPWILAGSVIVGSESRDNRSFDAIEEGDQTDGLSATSGAPNNGDLASAVARLSPIQLQQRLTEAFARLGSGKVASRLRTAVHPDGTVYCAFQRWASGSFPDLDTDIVITRDDQWGEGTPPFGALVDSGDRQVGQRVAANRFIRFNATMGQERLGSDLAIAVDPRDSDTVWAAWCDRVGGVAGADWTLHVSRSTDRGQAWSGDLRTIANAKNPALAINSEGTLGLLYQQFSGSTWDTKLELTKDGWACATAPIVLHTAPSNIPTVTFLPYIGDDVRLISIGKDFYGVFCGANTPNMANFPNGVSYQRATDWTNQTLLANDGVTVVQPSIDPFFFQWSDSTCHRGPNPLPPPPPYPLRGPISRGPISRGPISRGPVRGPISRGPIARGPISPGPPEASGPVDEDAIPEGGRIQDLEL